MPQLIAQYVFWTSLCLVIYTQAGYALMALLGARLGSRKAAAGIEETWPHVTLIIPAHNEEKVIEAKLRNSLELDYPSDRLRVVVASDGSTDRTNAIVASMADARVSLLAFATRRGKASVINDAAAAATGDVICLCDANVMFYRDALKSLVARLREPAIGAVTGDVRIASAEANFGEGESAYYSLEKRLQWAESQIGSVMGVDGGMYAMRRSLFQPLPPDTILDDFVISMRVLRQGARVVYEPSAIGLENGTPTARQEFRRRVRVAAGAVQSLKRREWPRGKDLLQWWQYLSHKLLRWTSPFWLLALLAANIMLVQSGWFYQVALLLQAAFYAAAALGFISLAWRKTRPGGVAFYFVLSHLAMVVGYLRGIANRQPVTWRQAERSTPAPSCEPRSTS